jgi:dTDP-4-amino-4,6-dideoxygalactose transaminase
LADAIRRLRNHGLIDRDTCVIWGNNSRLDALQAAILKTKLASLPQWTERRRHIASEYLARFSRLPFYSVPRERPDEYCVWHAFVVQTSLRNELQSFLRQRGIEALVHYPVPIHLQPVANELGYPRGSFPVCEQQAASILSLPIRSSLRDEEVAWIMDSVCAFFNH